MKFISYIFSLLMAFMLFIPLGKGQDAKQLTLLQVVETAKNQSIAARQAATTKETKYWEYRTFQSNYKPQLLLNGNLPAFSRTFIEVIQPDGTILFQPIRNNNSALGLSLSQNVSKTGGLLYATTQLQRFDDFERNIKLYNGTLFAVGFSQPLFQFNALKWDKRIEPLKYSESQQEYVESLEFIALRANNYFFDLLLSQVNLTIAETNLANTEGILRIAREKFELGKNSRNEILQLQLENLKAQKAVGTAKRDVEITTLNLKSFIGMTDEKIQLVAPQSPPTPQAGTTNNENMLKEAFDNRADAIGFKRRLLEAERLLTKAKADNGLNASLNATLGFSNRGKEVAELLNQPQNQQTISLQFTMPILDWGRSQARLKTAEANKQLIEYTIEQDKQIFKQEIYTQVTLFDMLGSQLSLTAQADSIASEKYQIAQDRYVLGNLSITDLSIAFTEKDQAKRDFIDALRNIWAAYYRLRWLTLYDFVKGEKLK